MPSLPRIITVDPTGNVARIVRATIDLSEYACRQIDVPSAQEALEEMKIGGSHLIVSALHLEEMQAFEMAQEVRQQDGDVGIVILADEDDPEMDFAAQSESGFVYLQRPIDIQQFTQVLFAGMRGDDVIKASRASDNGVQVVQNMGPVPDLDVDRARELIDALLTDLGAMAITLVGRNGKVILERGTPNYIDLDMMITALLPTMSATIQMRELVGGNTSSLQFFDGDIYDVYVLSVGLHHLLCIAYDGEKGQREFGSVNRYGRRVVEDLIALLGAYAFFIQPVAEEEAPLQRKRMTRMAPAVVLPDEDEELVELERAAEFSAPTSSELEKVHLEAIPDDQFDADFLAALENIDDSKADDMFSLDKLDGFSSGIKSRGTLSDEEARQVGILDDD